MRLLNGNHKKDTLGSGENRQIIFSNLSWKQISILIFFASVAIQLIYQLMQTSQVDEDTKPLQLPANCSDFEIVSGNLHNASVVLIGEDHSLQKLTLQCLTALMPYLPLFQNGFNTYLEGNTNADIRKNFKKYPTCQNATQCFSWDHEQAFSESLKIGGASIFVNAMHYMLEVQKQFGHDGSSMREYVMTPHFENLFLNYFQHVDSFSIQRYQKTLMQVRYALSAATDKTLEDIASVNFRRMQKAFGLSADTLNGSVQEVARAISRALLPEGGAFAALETKRDAALLRHAFTVSRPSFFIAGLAHIQNIKGTIANNDSVAALTLMGAKK